MRNKRASESIIDNDVDDTSNQTQGGVVSDILDEVITAPEDSGKSVTAVIASFIAGTLLTFAVAKGWLTTEQTAEYAPLLQGVIVLGVGWVVTQFLKSRSDVKVEVVRANADLRSARMHAMSSPFAGRAIGRIRRK